MRVSFPALGLSRHPTNLGVVTVWPHLAGLAMMELALANLPTRWDARFLAPGPGIRGFMPNWPPPGNPNERERWDQLLIQRLAEREPHAERCFLEAYGPVMLAAIESRLRRADGINFRADADDLLQAVVVKLCEDGWCRLRSWRSEASLSTWLSRIAMNAVVDWLRTRQADPLHRPDDGVLFDDFPDLALSAHQDLEIAEIRQQIRQVVSSVENQRYRDVLLLQIDEDLEPAEIAEKLGMAHGNARVLLNRARNALRMVMQQEFPDLMYGRE